MSKPITESILSNETRVFLMCCDFRSFSAVAHALGITQSAVSKIIRKFEDSIGFELFIRKARTTLSRSCVSGSWKVFI